jgi:O-acetyl-ADP-ribose deacetylase (regulator of RNase III)
MANERLGEEPGRLCFVIMPFGEKDEHGKLIDFDAVYRLIIKPAVESLAQERIRIRCLRCDEVEKAGLIHERMINFILDAEVAVVDISTANPNVYYELGVRHALRDRVTVLIRREGTRNPFNIAGMNTIDYDDSDADKIAQAQSLIGRFIRNGLLSSTRDSLVHAAVPGLEVSSRQGAITASRILRHAPANAPRKEIRLITGNLRHVSLSSGAAEDQIDIWVSSENINMQMARVFDASVSALIRYLGARRDDVGDIVEDTIADELRARMRGRQQVNPGMVVSTGSGSLAESHHVRRIFHVASVYGVIGGGYHPIAQVEQCVTAALVQADRESARLEKAGEAPYRSILFPLLTTGSGSASLVDNARKQLEAARNYLEARAAITRLERVCFLAPTKRHLSALQVALAELGIAEVGAADAGATAGPAGEAEPVADSHRPRAADCSHPGVPVHAMAGSGR